MQTKYTKVSIGIHDPGIAMDPLSTERDFTSVLHNDYDDGFRAKLNEVDAMIMVGAPLESLQLKSEAKTITSLVPERIVEFAIQYFPAISLIDLIRKDQLQTKKVGGTVLKEQLQQLKPEVIYWNLLDEIDRNNKR